MIPKFRAWDKDSKVMREIQHLVWAEDNLIAHCPPRGHEFSEWFTVILNGWEYQLMQSTGLKDKNGVEIFEGDVVKPDRGEPFVVKHFIEGQGVIKNADVSITGHSFEGIYSGEELEVLGNIHENAELLSSGIE